MVERSLLICEAEDLLLARVRQNLSVLPDVAIRHLRQPQEVLAALHESPMSAVLLELADGRRGGVLELLSRMAEQFPQAIALLIARRDCREFEWLTRELGAAYFSASSRPLGPALAIARRHWERIPHEAAAFEDRVWAELPWGD